MRHLIRAVLLALFCVASLFSQQLRVNKTFTVVGAGPINVATGLTTAASATDRLIAKRVFIQMLSGGAGAGYVLDGIRHGKVPAIATPSHVTAELSAAIAPGPGGSYSDEDAAGIDLSQMWVHGAQAGDTIKVSYVPKV